MLTAIKILLSALRKSVMPALIVMLVITNGLTLFNANFHDALYSALGNIAPLKWQQSSLKQKHTSLKQQKAILKQKHTTLSKKHEANDKKLKTIERRTKKISKKVSKRAIRNAEKNVAGVFLESIPIIGIVTIVGLTTMDVIDACDDMKDMDELESLVSSSNSATETEKVCGLEVPKKEEIMEKLGL